MPPLNEVINVFCKILKTPLILDNIGIDKIIIMNDIIENEDEEEDHNDFSEIKKYIVKIETEVKINEQLKYINFKYIKTS